MSRAPRRTLRLALVPVLISAALLFVLTSCPANRDGMPGVLAAAMDDTASAARSGAVAIDVWRRGRSTAQLARVQLSDARDAVTSSYDEISVLRAEDPADLARQSLLIQVMTDVIDSLNRAHAAVRGLAGSARTGEYATALTDAGATLERDYR